MHATMEEEEEEEIIASQFWRDCFNGNLPAVKRILATPNGKKVLNWKLCTYYDHSGLTIACLLNHYSVIEYLMSFPDLDVNCKIKGQNTPMHLVSNLKLALVMIQRSDIKLDGKNDEGRTPLWLASYHNNIDDIEIMIASGKFLDSTARSHQGCTAIEIARLCNHDELANLLVLYEQYPKEITKTMRAKLMWTTSASKIFALAIFLCDDFLLIV